MSKDPKRINVFRLIIATVVIISMLILPSCNVSKGKEKFKILSGSENRTLEPIIQDFAEKNGVDIEFTYRGSVDIMMELENPEINYDAVWPANSIWISLGDKNHKVKYNKSVMTTPVVFGIKKSVAESLGFVGKQVGVKDILKATEEGKLRFIMTSASQSNSGASAYIGFLYALLGNPETITLDDLKKPELKEQVKKLLSGINRSSGSSEWLKELFLKGGYEAMVNYEALMIETNNQLINRGEEPLYIIYPYDGLTIADSPLGYINNGDTKKEETFKKLQEYLLSDDIQKDILALGRRTGFGGTVENPDKNIFNPEWGIDTNKVLSVIRYPQAEVIQEALNLYQGELKKPSYTVFCLDFSGSMEGTGEEQLKAAMKLLLDRDKSKQYMLQLAPEDKVVVMPFDDRIYDIYEAKGSDEKSVAGLFEYIQSLSPGGGTDIYSPVILALQNMKKHNLEGYNPAIILMTDGRSNTGSDLEDLESALRQYKMDVPVFSIMFGSASEEQLENISELTKGRVFDGKKDLIDAFKKARGYN